jgi:hypothetical protein
VNSPTARGLVPNPCNMARYRGFPRASRTCIIRNWYVTSRPPAGLVSIGMSSYPACPARNGPAKPGFKPWNRKLHHQRISTGRPDRHNQASDVRAAIEPVLDRQGVDDIEHIAIHHIRITKGKKRSADDFPARCLGATLEDEVIQFIVGKASGGSFDQRGIDLFSFFAHSSFQCVENPSAPPNVISLSYSTRVRYFS